MHFVKKIQRSVLLVLIFFITDVNGYSQCTISNEVFVFSDGIYNPVEVCNKFRRSNQPYLKLKDNRINFGLTKDDFKCFIVRMRSSCAVEQQLLSIDNTSLDSVLIFDLNKPAEQQLVYLGGDLIPYDRKRKFVWHVAPVTISPVPSYYFVALKATAKNINVRYEILPTEILSTKYRSMEMVILMYTGAVLLIMSVMLVSYFVLRRSSILAYLGYVVCLAGWIFLHYGYGFRFLYPQMPILNEVAKPLTSLGGCICLLYLLRNQFSNELNRATWLRYATKLFLPILFLSFILMLFLLVPTLIYEIKAVIIFIWHLVLLIAILLTITIPLRFYKTSTSARIFSFAALIICLTIIVQQLSNAGIINHYFVNEHGTTIGNLLEVSVMAIGLFYNVLEEKWKQEEQVFRLEQEHTQTLKKLITVQDAERTRIAGDLHDNIGPMLAALKINFRRIIGDREVHSPQLLIDKTETIIEDSIAEIRNIAHNLMPKGLSSRGLIFTLNDYFEGIGNCMVKKLIFNTVYNLCSIPICNSICIVLFASWF